MKGPDRAIILAAGLGTRMRPLSEDLPKPLMPFWGRPILEHALHMLRDWGVREVAVNCHHRAEEIIEWLRRHPVDGLRVSISYEPDILGTGGPLRRLAWFIDGKPFWMFNADVVAELDPLPLLKRFARRDRPLAALWMHRERGPRTVAIEDGAVRNFIAPEASAENTATFCGLHLVRPEILDFLPAEERFHSIITAYIDAMNTGRIIGAAESPGAFWSDLGKPEQYLEAHREIHVQGKSSRLYAPSWTPPSGQVEGFFCAGSGEGGAAVSPQARMKNVVMWDRSTLHHSARAENLIVGRGATVKGSASHIVVRPEQALSDGELRALEQANWRDYSVMLFPPRGSDRSFFRIHDGRRSAILIRYGAARAENEHFVALTRYLAGKGIRVPAVLLDRPAGRFTLVEDLGERDLLSAPPSRRLQHYRKALVLVAKLHRIRARTNRHLQPAFGPKLYQWEHRYFAEHYLREERNIDEVTVQKILRELRGMSRIFTGLPQVLVHRDLQSTNVFLVKGEAALIDYQGMRLGPAAYDLASLIADPYLELQQHEEPLLHQYRKSGGQIGEEYYPACVQRLVQAIGAYARLGRQPGTQWFAQHLPAGLRHLQHSLNRVQGCSALKSVVAGALEN